MLRALFILVVTLALAGPARADDMDTCRDRQAEAKARLEACEKVIAAGQVAGKDLATALFVRGNALLTKRDNDKAIVAFGAAHDADPDNVGYLNSRGIAYERKGDDDHAMADYNLALQMRPNFGSAFNNRGTLYLRKGAFQSALDDFNAALKYAPNMYIAHTNRARVLTMNKDFDGALADFAEAQRIDPAAPQTAPLSLHDLYRDGQVRRGDRGLQRRDRKSAEKPVRAQRPGRSLYGQGRPRCGAAGFQCRARPQSQQCARPCRPGPIVREEARSGPGARRLSLGELCPDAVRRDRYLDRPEPGARAAGRAHPASAGATVRRVALIVGNGAYKNVHQLDNPPRDAKLIADALRDIGFQTVTLANDLTRDKFFEALHAFAREAEKADWAVVYYAGHGLEIGGVNYLVPVDAKFASDHDAESEAVALEQVIAAVGGARKLRLVMLDACRDNPFAPTMQRTIALKLVDKGLSNIEPEAGFMVVYAAKHGETALDGDGVDSPFAVALAHDIKEPNVEVRKLFDIVRDDVWTASKHQQQPFTYGSPPGREDFYFVAGK